jgi:hypothetical protein
MHLTIIIAEIKTCIRKHETRSTHKARDHQIVNGVHQYDYVSWIRWNTNCFIILPLKGLKSSHKMWHISSDTRRMTFSQKGLESPKRGLHTNHKHECLFLSSKSSPKEPPKGPPKSPPISPNKGV